MTDLWRGNNQTKGHSAYNRVRPGLLDALDFTDVASLASPKPALFFPGRRYHLFPVLGVEAAFAQMRAVWATQGAGNRLVTKRWTAG